MNLCFLLIYLVFEKDTKKHLKNDDNLKVQINWTGLFISIYVVVLSFIVSTSHVDMNYKTLFRTFEAKFFVYKIDESCLQFRFSMRVSRLLPRFCYNSH